MKAMNTIIKILTALAAVAGIIYIVATYGEQIVAWCRKMLASMPKCPCCEKDEVIVETVEEATAEEITEEEPAAEEVPVEEVVVADHEPVADEADFAE